MTPAFKPAVKQTEMALSVVTNTESGRFGSHLPVEAFEVIQPNPPDPQDFNEPWTPSTLVCLMQPTLDSTQPEELLFAAS